MFKLAFKFARLKILTTCYLVVFLGSLSSGAISGKSFLAIFVLIAWYVHAASSNDYADRKIDVVNLKGAKDRPLVSKSLSFRKLWTIHVVAGALALAFSMFYGVQAVLLTAIVLALDYAYSFKPFRITDRGALAQFMLPVAYVIYPFSLGYWSIQTEASYPWLLVTGLYSGFIARLFLKDFRDIKGDVKFGKLTFLIRHGRNKTCAASWLFGFTSLILLCLAVHFSAGVLFILILGHIFALYLLVKLAGTKDIETQVELIAVLAKIANTSVISVLLYYLSLAYLDLAHADVTLPLFIGILLLTATWGGYQKMALKLNSPSFFQYLVWLPIKLYMYLFCEAKVEGIENIKKVRGNVIFASNHVTELDPLLIVASLPLFSDKLPIIYVAMEKKAYSEIWNDWRKFFYGGKFFEMIGGYEAYKGLNDYRKALRNHLQAIEKGQSVCIFPVGRRHGVDEVSDARGGASFLAKETGLPVIPIHIKGIGRGTNTKDPILSKKSLTITFGKPLYAKDLFSQPLDKIKNDDRKKFEEASVRLMTKIVKL